MLKKIQFQLFLTLGVWLSVIVSGLAQTFPVTISTQITQPSPIYLNNYADATTINSPVKVQIILNDLTISNRQIRLKCYFQGQSISLMTNDFVVGAHDLFLEGGVPLQLTNVDLAPYFQYQNLLGVNPNQYAQALPEGIYTFSVEVYDFATNKKLSKKTSVTTIIFQNDPPFLNLPLNNASIMQQNIQNIIFSWTPRQINVSNVEYEFSLVEIWDKYTPVQNAFAYTPPLYTTTTRSTTLQYGIAEPQLIPGKKYAWRVKAKALLGAEEIGVFKNNGYSEIYSFDYEIFCTAPLAINVEGISENQAKISWSGSIDNFDYQVNYREKNADSDWYKVVTPRENLTITNLKPNTTYEFTVGASCDVGKYTHSIAKEFTTLVRDEIAFQGCGIKPDPADLTNTTPLKELLPNDVIAAGDFPIVVLHATGSNGTFSGDGYVTLPFIEKFRLLIDAADAIIAQNAEDKAENEKSAKVNISENTRIRITFNNIGLNTDFKLISGEIIAAYDPKWSSMADLDGVFNDVLGDAGNVINHDIQYTIESVVKNEDGSITIKGPNGIETKIDKTVNDIIITDKDGKQYAVPANAPTGEIKQTGQLAPGGIPTSKNTNGMGSGGDVAEISSSDVNVIFSKGGGKYSFDTAPTSENGSLTKTYQTIPKKGGGTYNVNYKAISDNPNTDVVVATVDFKNGKTKKDLVFKTQNGTAIDSTQIVWKDNVATLTLKKTLDFAKETIIATVKPATPKDPKEGAGKYDIAGTMDLWHLTNKKVNLTLVRVNNATIPNDAQSQLNAIYEPAGVTFNVNIIDVTLDNTWGESIETSESSLLATYTPEQQQITANLKLKLGADYKKDTYYVIYTDTPSDKSNILGFMPLKRQYGFIFNKVNIVRTLAHELGHGVFGLQHPFTEYNTSTTTDLLMDYGTGVLVSHNDWQVLHAPGLQLYPFIQGDQEGESYWTVLDDRFLNLDKDPKDKTKGSFSFLSYHGEIVTLNKANLDHILFNYGTSDYQSSGTQAPGILQSFIINTNGLKNLYKIDLQDGKYKDEKGTPYVFPDIKPAMIDGVIAFVPCGADGKTYKFKKSNLSTYSNANAKASLTDIDKFPFVPFSVNNQALESGGIKISQSFVLSDNESRWSYDQDTAEMTKNYCEKPELFYILKIAQIRKNYPEAFDKFTNTTQWENPTNTTVTVPTGSMTMVPSGSSYTITYVWANYLAENTALQTDYKNKTNLENYFKVMYQQFSKHIISSNKDNDAFWSKLDTNTSIDAILSQVKNESIVELEKKDIQKKIIAIKTIQSNSIVNEFHEEALLKLFESTTPTQGQAILDFLVTKYDGPLGKEPYLKSLLYDIDNKYLFFGDDNRAVFVNNLIKIWKNVKKTEIEDLKTLFNKDELTSKEVNTILKLTINYNYKSIYDRFFTHLKMSASPGAGITDTYIKTNAKYTAETGKINVETLLALGFISMSDLKKPVDLDPFQPIIFTNNTTLSAFNEVTESKENMYLPAFIVYYADKEATGQTVSDIAQTAVDVATLVIPGAQLTTLGKVLFYADKISSVTSITARATADNNPEFSKVAGLISLFTGVASASTMVMKPSLLKVDNYTNILDAVNNSSNIATIAKDDRLLIQGFLQESKATLVTESKFDGAMSVKFENAMGKLGLAINITSKETMISKLVSKFPKLEKIFAKTKNQLTFDNATGLLKYNGKTIANVTSNAEDAILTAQKVANIDRTASNMEEFTEEAAIYCKGGNCDLVLGACFTGNTLIKTKKGLIPIQDIKENDEVWSYNEKTKTNRWSTVVQKVNLATKKLYQVVVGKDTLQATSEHPFFTKKGWMNANLVTKGMMVLLANGTWGNVEANIAKDTTATVYNIEVLPAHTFYIGNEQVLVHNGFDCFKQRFKNLANASDDFFEDFKDNLEILGKFDSGELNYPAWQILNKETLALRTNIDELKLVSKNLDEIKNAGGYLKWKALKGLGPQITKFNKKFIDYINQFDNTATNPDKHNKVWRVMRDEQLMSNPIVAKSETGLTKAGKPYTIDGHVRNGSDERTITPYISSFTNKEEALAYALNDNGKKVVEIDLTKINGKYIDLSNESIRKFFLGGPRVQGYAKKSFEFLIIIDEIPTTAFKIIN
ncbi:polymorphic toxin-type HINT domain-containing protein [Flavobacterium sp. LC2016-12]|uniref:polymorphic toxin-type HINT domain-containing protein n=1 Tax=Flavobacterium sp. LC2016-12 TaxID=2783794 RepID=UPI00188AFD53|nr:polymorphic toxin-type HINT domain-containing protein [Flavobacterium sp. LC2016-12]MBF4463899.1 fibronectin type III domain-containing protein [Flavobacterium sp. LC2016-12]